MLSVLNQGSSFEETKKEQPFFPLPFPLYRLLRGRSSLKAAGKFGLAQIFLPALGLAHSRP